MRVLTFLIFFTFILIAVIFLAIKIFQERENISISEKFIKANIYLSSEKKEFFTKPEAANFFFWEILGVIGVNPISPAFNKLVF